MSWWDSLSDTRKAQFTNSVLDNLQAIAYNELEWRKDHGVEVKRGTNNDGFLEQVMYAERIVEDLIVMLNTLNAEHFLLRGGLRVARDRVAANRES